MSFPTLTILGFYKIAAEEERGGGGQGRRRREKKREKPRLGKYNV